jgi:iron complex outermembrane recepter protein
VKSTSDGRSGQAIDLPAICAALTAVALLAVSPAVTAADTQTAATAADSSALSEVVVTARFRTENLEETPLSITAVSGEMLESQGLTNVADLNAIIPNANIRQQANIFGPNPQIGLRGVNTTDFIYTSEPGVAVYIDDIYNGTLTASAMDLLDIERVEVLRGPQGTLFGKNALGGAIRLISKTPKGDDSGYVEATYGQFNELNFKGAYDYAIVPGHLFIRLSGASTQIDGYQARLDFTCQMIANGTPQLAGSLPEIQPSDEQNRGDCRIGENGGDRTHAARLMLRYVATDDLEINLTGDYSRDEAEPGADSLLKGYNPADPLHSLYNNLFIFPKYGMRYNDDRFVTGDPYTTFASYSDPVLGRYWPTEAVTIVRDLSAKIDYNLSEHIHVKLVGAHRRYTSDWASDGDLGPFDLSTTLNLQRHEQNSAELQISGTLFNQLDWTTGAFYYDSTSHLGGYVTFGDLSFLGIIPNFAQNDNFTTSSKSGFAHLVYNPTARISVTGGIRYTSEQKTYTFDHTGFLTIATPLRYGKNHVDWLAGVDYKLTDDKMVYATVSTGFRSDGAEPRPFVAAQLQSIPSETITAYEVGFKGDFFDHHLRTNLSAFLNDYSPRISTRIGYQCSPANATDPGPFFPITTQLCPAGTPLAGQMGFLWINYFSAPGKAKGVELETTATPFRALSINATASYYTYRGSITNPLVDGYIDPSVREQPEVSFSIGAQYAINFGNAGTLTPRVDWFYQGYRTNGPENLKQQSFDVTPGYALVNARLTYESANGHWSAALEAQNVFNKFYWIQLGPALTQNPDGTTSPFYNREGVPSRPRVVALTLRRTFF